MPRVELTQNLQRHVACPPMEVRASTLREALDAVFAVYPALRSYVLDDQGEVRKHVVIFIDGEQLRDRRTLSDPVQERSAIHVMQALSGGSRCCRSMRASSGKPARSICRRCTRCASHSHFLRVKARSRSVARLHSARGRSFAHTTVRAVHS